MAEVPKAVAAIEDFGGLALQVDELNLQSGQTHTQTNFCSEDTGSLKTRPGYRALAYDANYEPSDFSIR